MYTHNHISRNHYEKEFYKWLQEERKESEPRSRQMVIELARLELLAGVLGFRSSKLFSRLLNRNPQYGSATYLSTISLSRVSQSNGVRPSNFFPYVPNADGTQ